MSRRRRNIIKAQKRRTYGRKKKIARAKELVKHQNTGIMGSIMRKEVA